MKSPSNEDQWYIKKGNLASKALAHERHKLKGKIKSSEVTIDYSSDVTSLDTIIIRQ